MPQDCHRSQVMEPEAKVGPGNGGLGIERDTARKKLRAETDQEVLVSAFNNPGGSVASCTGVANSEWLVVSLITLKRYVKLTLCVELVHDIVQGMAELTRKGRNLYILLTIGRIEWERESRWFPEEWQDTLVSELVQPSQWLVKLYVCLIARLSWQWFGCL